MKHIVWFVTTTAALSLAGPVAAQEPADKQIEFVRKLRDKGYADLALVKLEELAKNPAPELARLLPLERARTRVALGRNKSPEERLALVGAAEGDLRDFISKNQGKPDAVLAQLEMARLAVMQGQAWLNRAYREEDAKAQQALAKKAGDFLARGNKELDLAIKKLPAGEKAQARFDRGIVLVDQGRANFLLSFNKEGADFIRQARKAFEAINFEDDTSAIGILAGAWLVKCCYEGDDPQAGARIYKMIMALKGPEARPAQRWARLFRIQSIREDSTIKAPDKKADLTTYKRGLIRKESEKWLADYPKFHDTPEGHAVQFELAQVYLTDARIAQQGKTPADKERAAELFAKAQKYYAVLAETDSDYAEKANQLNLAISFMKMEKMKSLDQLRTFDEWNLKARYEIFKFREAKEDKDRRGHLRSASQALRRALALADARTPPSRVSSARAELMSLYVLSGDLYRAAVVGEALAREQPPLKHSALAAGHAIEAYYRILYQLHEDTELNRDRLRSLAEYVVNTQQKLWENEIVMPVAHYYLALLYDRDERYQDAIAQLEKLPPSFDRYTEAQSRLIFIAIRGSEKSADEKEKKALEAKARAAASRLTLPAGADGETAYWYFNAEVQNAHRFLYVDAINHARKGEMTEANAKLLAMSKLNDQLRAQFAGLKAKMRKEYQAPLLQAFDKLERTGRYVRAELEYKAGNFDKVLEPKLTGEVVAQVEKLGATAGPIRLKDYDVTGAILGLALRANVQKGNVPKAKEILKLLERVTGEEGTLGVGTSNVLRVLVAELSVQVKELKKAGDNDRLKKVVANFSSFLEDYAKNPGPKGLGVNEIMFLGSCYESLNQPDKAAQFYKKYPEPAALKDKIDLKKPNLTEEEKKVLEEKDKEISQYWGARLKLAQQLRLAKDFKEATKVLNHLKKHPNARGGFLADVELNQILEDNNLWGNAINKWGELMKNPGLMKQAATDNNAKKLYFDAYLHHALCWYKYSQQPKVKAANKDKQYVKVAADYLLRLEFSTNPDGWNLVRDRVQEMLTNEPALRAQYETLKPDYEKKRKGTSGKTP